MAGVNVKKAIFLCVRNFHSKKSNQDYRVVDLFTPYFKSADGFDRGGVQTCFIPTNSDLGNGVPTGALVRPEFVADPYSNRMELVGLELLSDSPYDPADFEG